MDHDKRPPREVPTYAELLEFADSLPPDEAEALLTGARQAPLAPEPEASEPTPGTAGVCVVGGFPGPDDTRRADDMVPEEGHSGQPAALDVGGA